MRLAIGNASLRCEFCKAVVTLTPDDAGVKWLEEAPDLECPSCAAALWNAVLARVPLHACKNCHGLLVAMNALEPLVESMRAGHPGSETPAPADPADLKRRFNCPQCHQHMDSDFYAGGGNVVVSGCERDEVNWLEGGVLMRIVRAPRASDAEAAY
ncbi:MAG TPA: zf-TFIIB domain-containing protein [Terracidiphilus sp.]|jgi:Zn-finger nucleic acid-binding protein|nr:zf-TFIIB domain-containing protein [Terracidiphilus sp.]